MARVQVESLGAPKRGRLVADFTNGSIPLAAIVNDSGFPNASGRTYSYDSRGIQISLTGGTTGQYASAKWEPHAASPGATIDLSGSDYLGIEVEFPEGTGAVYDTLSIFITTQTGTTYTNYQNRTVLSGADKTPKRQVLMVRFSDTWTKVNGGPLNFATIGKIEFRLGIHASAQNLPAHCFIRKVYVGRNRTKVMFSYDDAMDGQMLYAFPTFEANGWTATLHASPTHINKAGRLTFADLQTLYAAGWDMGIQQYDDSADIPVNYAGQSGLTSDGAGTATWANVSGIPHLLVPGQQNEVIGAANAAYNGPITVLTTPDDHTFTYAISGTPATPDFGWPTCSRLALDEAQRRWQTAIAYYQAAGMTRGNEFAAYSNGVTSEWVESWMPDLGFVMARTTRINTTPNVGFDPRCADVKALMRMPAVAMDGATAAALLGHLDTCIFRGTSLEYYGHQIAVGAAALTQVKSEFDLFAAGVRLRERQGLCDVIGKSDFMRTLRAYGRSHRGAVG